ncbi:MAG: hypothetical protein DWQ04_30520 [Chloroflexi bacterium]|nr:MAG: hypothetical protein DWQ04_30520 [Chloroflexota bacterium]
MIQTQLINAVIEWEWRLKTEEEKQENSKAEPYENATVADQSIQKGRKFNFMQIFKLNVKRIVH